MLHMRLVTILQRSLIPLVLILAILSPLAPHNPVLSVLPSINEASATTPPILGVWSDLYLSRSIVDSTQTAGSTVDMKLNVTSAGRPTISNNLNGFDIYIKINDTLIRPRDQASQSGLQPASLVGGLFDPALYSPPPFVLANTYDSTTGTIRVAVILLGPSAPSASGILFSLQLDVRAVGQSEIDIQEQSSVLLNPATVSYSTLDGFFTNKLIVHEIIVNGIVVSSEQVPRGDVATIGVSVANLGTETETVTVSAEAGTIPLGTQVLTMIPFDLLTVIFPWNTTGVALGVYIINATATVAVDDFSKDNSVAVERINVVVIDLAVTSIVPANTIVAKRQAAEQLFEVMANVTNQGSITSRANVTLYGNRTLAGQTVIGGFLRDLPANATQTFTFQWNITRTPLGTYLLSAEVSALSGEKDTADNALQDGTVRVFQPTVDVGITGLFTSGTFIALGETLSLSADLENGGTTNQTFTVQLFANATMVAERTQFLARNSTGRVNMSWNTTGYSAGSYSISGKTILSGDEYPKNDQRLDGVVQVFVNRIPIIVFQATPLLPQPGQLVIFNANDTTDPDIRFADNVATLTWDFGDGSPTISGANRTAVHSYAQPGSYTVRLTASDLHGGTNSSTQLLRVNAQPTATFTFTPASPTSGQDITFDASGSTDDSSIANYAWDFGDGTQGTGRQLTHRYSAPGSYNVTLTLTDSDGTMAGTSRVVVVTEPPSVVSLPLIIGGAVAGAAAIGAAVYLLRRRKQSLPQPSG